MPTRRHEATTTLDQQTVRFERFIWPLLPAVVRTASIISGDAAEVDDLAQETMLRAYRGMAGLRSDADAKPWLLAILRNVHIDRLRIKKAAPLTLRIEDWSELPERRKGYDACDDGSENRWDPRTMLESFSDQRLIDALRQLPPDICWAVLLAHVQGLDMKEAAAILGVPVGTVKSRCFRGRESLKAVLAAPSVGSAIGAGRPERRRNVNYDAR
jgi:RNA polymerase sigma-70 factor (ECF subfamily)